PRDGAAPAAAQAPARRRSGPPAPPNASSGSVVCSITLTAFYPVRAPTAQLTRINAGHRLFSVPLTGTTSVPECAVPPAGFLRGSAAEPPLVSSRLAVMLQERGGVNERLACERGPPARGSRPW